MKKNKVKEQEDKTYSGEGMVYGVAAGSIIGTIVIAITNVTYYLPICVSTGMVIGLAIGSNIKKNYWIRYFKSNKTMKDMYSSLLGIPVAGATLPVLAFLLLGIYGKKNVFLIVSTIILGIGHIGIHLNHRREVR